MYNIKDRQILEVAREALMQQRSKIDETLGEINSQLGKRSPGRQPTVTNNGDAPAAPVKRKKRHMSPEGRAAIAAATKARWARQRAAGNTSGKLGTPTTKLAKPKRKLSDAQLAAMRKNAMRARKAAKAAKKTEATS